MYYIRHKTRVVINDEIVKKEFNSQHWLLSEAKKQVEEIARECSKNDVIAVFSFSGIAALYMIREDRWIY